VTEFRWVTLAEVEILQADAAEADAADAAVFALASRGLELVASLRR
jgi:hypothetical protein